MFIGHMARGRGGRTTIGMNTVAAEAEVGGQKVQHEALCFVQEGTSEGNLARKGG